jgi:hypothetical protein
MTTPAHRVRREPMEGVLLAHSTRLFGARRADPGFTFAPNRRRGSPRASETAGIIWRWLEKDGHMANPGLTLMHRMDQ